MSIEIKECPLIKNPEELVNYRVGAVDYELEVESLASKVGYIYATSSVKDREDLAWIIELMYKSTSFIREGKQWSEEDEDRLVRLCSTLHGIDSIVYPITDSITAAYCFTVCADCRKIVNLIGKFSEAKEVNPAKDLYYRLSDYFYKLAVKNLENQNYIFTKR